MNSSSWRENVAAKVAMLNSKSVAVNIGLTAAVNVALLLVGLLTGILAARLLGVEGRGEWAAVQAWALMLSTVGSLGLGDSLVYYVGRFPNQKRSLIWTTWLVLVPLGVVWMVIGFALMPRVLREQSMETIQAARWFLILVPLSYVIIAHRAFQGWRDFGRWNLIRLVKPILYLTLLLAMLLLGLHDVQTVTLGFLAITVVTAVLTVFLLSQTVALRKIAFAQDHFPGMLKYGLQSALGSAPQNLNMRLDQLILAGLISSRGLGLYAVSVTWSMAAGSLISSLGSVALPYITEGQDSDRRSRFAKTSRVSVALAFVTLFPMLFLTPLVLPAIYGVQFSDAIPTAMILVLASVPWQVSKVIEDGFRGLGVPSVIVFAELIALGINVILLILLLPEYDILGAAIASLVAYSVLCAGLLAFAVGRFEYRLTDLLVLRPTELSLSALRFWR